MLRRNIFKCSAIIAITLCFLFLGNISNANTNREITTDEGKTSTVQQTKYNRQIRENMQISYDNLTSWPDLHCVQRGAPVTSVKSESNPQKDATLEVNGIKRTIKEFIEGNLELRSSQYNYTRNQPDAESPYGTIGSTIDTGRTIAKYNSVGTKELTNDEAFIYAHNKDTSMYPDYTQSAVWINMERRGLTDTTFREEINAQMENTAKGRELAKAADIFGNTVEKWNNFLSRNSGNPISDDTNRSKTVILVDKNKGTATIGKFKYDYVRGVYKPKTELNSKLMNSDGVFSFSGIKSMKLYSDSSMTREISFKLIFPEVDSSGNRIKILEGDQNYKYPYPGEEFYIEVPLSEIKDPNVDLLSNMKVEVENMTAHGTAEKIEGTIDEWKVESKDKEIVCNSSVRICQHGRTSAHKLPDGSLCIPEYCYKHRDHKVGDGHLQGHDFYVEVQKTGTIQSQKMDVKREAVVEKHINYVTVPLGQNNSYGGYPSFIPFFPYRPWEPEYPPYLPWDPDPNKPDKPTEPEEPEEPEPGIKLTFDIAGNVWVDNPSGKETLANGTKDAGEEGLANIIVRLYKVGETEPIKETLTNMEGYYKFQYVKIGYDYYVEFTYDGMTYKTTNYLYNGANVYAGQDLTGLNQDYRKNPENYVNASHVVETLADRLAFNSKFMEISNNMAMGTSGLIPLSYRTYMAEQGAVSALITTDTGYIVAEPFQMTTSTKTTGLYYPLDDKYITDTTGLELVTVDGKEYYYATYPGTLNINMGLIKREKGDFAVKNDVYQTIVTMKENIQTYKYNNKNTNAISYDAHTRNGEYYTDSTYTQKIDKSDYNWRFDSTYAEYSDIVKNAVSQKDELNVYVEYKYLIRNQSALQFGSVLELINHFDSNLEYSSSYDFTNTTSWLETNMIDDEGEVYRETIDWDIKGTNDGYTTMTTDSIKDKVLVSGQTLELHVILKVKKDANRNVLMDLGQDEYKDNIIEIGKYTFNEGTVDRDSNPGSVIISDTKTYEDDTDIAPLVKLVFNNYEENNGQGKVVSGYVWEDLVETIMSNNLYTGNGLRDVAEKGIPNVKVELIEVLMDKSTGNELEIIKKSGDVYSFRTDSTGHYKFTNLPTGTYKVKFTYGDEIQLKQDVTFNGQDYKSVSTDTLRQQYQNPGMEVMILADTSESMNKDGKGTVVSESVKRLIESLYNKVQTVKIGAALFSEPKGGDSSMSPLSIKPNKNNVISLFNDIRPNSGTSLEKTLETAIAQFTANAASKVIVIVTDGYINSNVTELLNKAERLGIKVISVVAATDEWPINSFGTESNPTTGKLYYIRDINILEYVTEVALEDTLQELSKALSNTLYAKDVQKEYNTAVDSEIGDVYTRQKNIDYTTSMKYANGSVVDGRDTTDISALAKNTQMTAITPTRNIMIQHNNNSTADANLGLIERPKVELQIREEISRIEVKLSNGEVIIDTAKDLTQNVQIIPNARYNIFLDDEIMQGATITVKYRVTVFNNGHVDTLGEYFDYDMYNQAEVAKHTASIATRVGTIYSYFTNLMFRAEDNNNWEIEVNKLNTDIKNNGTNVSNWTSFIKNGHMETPDVKNVNVVLRTDGKPEMLSEKAMWEAKTLVRTGVENDTRIQKGSVKAVQTNSFNTINLYPVISKEALSDKGLSSVSTYIQFSKTISTNDITDTLEYRQSVEIVERLNEAGRRDYVAVPGNYSPHSEITEYDSARVADIVVLPPFGGNKENNYILWITAAMAVMIGGVIFIKRRVLGKPDNNIEEL